MGHLTGCLGLALLALMTAGAGLAAADEAAIARLMARPVQELDAGLPAEPLSDWLADQLPKDAGLTWADVPCPGDLADAAPSCLGLEIDLISRARQLSLTFAPGEEPGFRAGVMASPDAVAALTFNRLAEMPHLLTAPLALAPLVCPTGTTLHTRREHAGLFEWCEGAEGRDGPARSWFSEGIYLMEKGAYRGGRKLGTWLVCNRFERCRFEILD